MMINFKKTSEGYYEEDKLSIQQIVHEYIHAGINNVQRATHVITYPYAMLVKAATQFIFDVVDYAMNRDMSEREAERLFVQTYSWGFFLGLDMVVKGILYVIEQMLLIVVDIPFALIDGISKGWSWVSESVSGITYSIWPSKAA